MSASASSSLLQNMAIAAISLAKTHYSDQQFALLDIPRLQQTLRLVSECVPYNYATDPLLLHHISDCLINGYSNEETIMHVFLLYIYRLVDEGSQHPLERGIIKQKINGILPIFETGFNQGVIRAELYDKNADALAAIADNSADVPELISALGTEYRRLQA